MTDPDGTVVRVRLDFAYDGTDYAGWGIQPGLRTIQGVMEAGLARIVRFGEPPRIVVAGRTDAGVHARGQVAHVDLDVRSWERMPGHSTRTPGQSLVRRLNGVLPADINVVTAEVAAAGFDARFSALGRRYAYRVCDDVRLRDPLTRRYVLWHDPLDLDALSVASSALTGLRDFAPFCRPREGATTIRELTEFSWERVTTGPDTGLVVATVEADAFCHSMVRSLVGAVLAVGKGRRDGDWLAGVVATPGRSHAVKVALARGLTLERVSYPADEDLALRARVTRDKRSLD